MPSARIRVLIADDHQRFRDALRRMLENDPDIEVVAEVMSGDEVIACAARVRPEVVCMDYRMPGLNGIEATRQLAAACPEVKIIGLSANAESHFASVMHEAGAAGYIAKNDVSSELLPLIHRVTRPVNGGIWLRDGTAAELTAREREVLQGLAEGSSESEIAEKLELAPAMIAVHQRNMMRKLGLNSVAELARFAASPGCAPG